MDEKKLDEVLARRTKTCRMCGTTVVANMPVNESADCHVCALRMDANALLLYVNELYGDTKSASSKHAWSRSHELLSAIHERLDTIE